ADSDGFEKDNARPDAYRWRDWVIDVINSDMPFDQFTIEQLAGDILPDATAMQTLATAFHRQTLTNTEGGTDKEQWRVEACFDRTETTGAVWLGLTVGCARCHSHKYDAISQAEYYQLFAVYNNGDEETSVVPKSPEEVAAYGPLKAAYDARVAEATAALRAEQQKLGPAISDWETRTQSELARIAVNPMKLYAIENPAAKADSEVKFDSQSDGSFLLSGNSPDKVVYTITGQFGSTNSEKDATTSAPATPAAVTALRLDALSDKSLPASGPGRAKGSFVLSEIAIEVSPTADFAQFRKLEFTTSRASYEKIDRPSPVTNAIDGNEETGWAIDPQFGKDHWASFTFKDPLDVTTPLFVRIRLSQQAGQQQTLGRFKLSFQTGLEPSPLSEEILKVIAVSPDKRDEVQKQFLVDHVSR
ncbi:MAG: DUF1549 domain-containing protein, partial [Planctomycetes bacterium]|nr:DUF1549 domain-containing protein [Planctomycetota bacterium]